MFKSMTTSLKPRYIPLVQKPFCCNVTCLAMILYRRGYGLFDQEKLAKFFDVRVSPEARKTFTVRLGLYSSVGFDEGIKTIESAALVNQFFRKQKISLLATAVRASEIKDLNRFITKHLNANDDLWIEYKTFPIHGGSFIHDNVIESIQVSNGSTRAVLVDPDGQLRTRTSVPLSAIKEAISHKHGRETGFIVIRQSNENLI